MPASPKCWTVPRRRDDRVVFSKGIVDHFVVRAIAQDVGVDQPSERDERDALLCRLQCRVYRGAGRIQYFDCARFDGPPETWGLAIFAQGHGGCFNRLHRAGGDQKIGREPEAWHADQMKIANTVPDHGPDRRHRDAAAVFGQGQLGAAGNAGD